MHRDRIKAWLDAPKIWRGRDWTPHVQFLVGVLLFTASLAAIAGTSYLVGWGVEGTRLDPFQEEVQNTNGSLKFIVDEELVGGPEDRGLSGFTVLMGALGLCVIGYAVRPRKVVGV